MLCIEENKFWCLVATLIIYHFSGRNGKPKAEDYLAARFLKE
jgi:hypothetical protein